MKKTLVITIDGHDEKTDFNKLSRDIVSIVDKQTKCKGSVSIYENGKIICGTGHLKVNEN